MRKTGVYLVLVSLFAIPSAVMAESTVIDIMILYTAAARENDAGGQKDQMEAHILATVAAANELFARSEVEVELNLVNMTEVAYVESGSIITDWQRLSDPDDKEGHLNEIHQWRDDWGADLVCLFTDLPPSGTHGYAHVLTDPAGRPDHAFTVVASQAALSKHLFAHEIGHNLGSGHSHGDPIGPGALPYSHGHPFDVTGTDGVTRHYRTVMASSTSNPFRTQVNYFSNPNVQFQGVPTGIPDGEETPADNARAFNEIAPRVAAYRESRPPLPVILQTSPVNFGVAAGNSVALSVHAAGTPPLTLQWYEGESGETGNPVGGATADFIVTPKLDADASYWVRAANGNGTADSGTMTVAALPAPTHLGIDQEQPNSPNAIRLSDFGELWQEFVPESDYLASVEVFVERNGSPGDLLVWIQTADGMLLAGRRTSASSTGSFSWAEIPVKVFLNAGQTYRIVLQVEGPSDAQNTYRWAGDGSGNPYPKGSSSIDEGWPNFAFAFRTHAAQSNVAPFFTTHPSSQTVGAGATVRLYAAAAGNPAPDLHWERSSDNGAGWEQLQEDGNFSGTKSDTLRFETAAEMDGHMFRAVAANGVGSPVSSNSALLTVHTRILSLSENLDFGAVEVGQSSERELTITNTGNSALTIISISFPAAFSGSWTQGTIASGASRNMTVTFSPIEETGYGGEIVIESDKTSGDASVTVAGTGTAPSPQESPPRFTRHPEEQPSVEIGATVEFTAAATGNPPPGLNWERSTDGGVTWEALSGNVTFTGTESGTLSFAAEAAMDGHMFRAVAENGVGSPVVGDPAHLTVFTRVLALYGNLDFGEVEVGESVQRELSLENTGNDTLTVTSVSFPAAFSGSWTQGSIGPGGNRKVSVTFTPAESTEYSGAIEVVSDMTSGGSAIPVSGRGEPPAPGDAFGSLALGDGWKWSPWFKFFYPVGDRWLWHLDHGWIYPMDADPSGAMWLYSFCLGWIWTGAELYPHLFSVLGDDWLKYRYNEIEGRSLYFTFGEIRWEGWDFLDDTSGWFHTDRCR